jgi:hypothetical protein
VRFLSHEWTPDPHRPGTTRCGWCDRPFAEAGGTVCEVDSVAREITLDLPVLPDPPPPRAWGLWIAAGLLVAVLAAALTLLGLTGYRLR